ncbi:telomere repeat-binding protein 2-like [Zingiber officinale]|uniref:telomere repeat-binding protein 2-like n=1 Tax=Zingiber officinale TaxID=94328 RepID=UPI001C4AD291|nr:telomere repeat-binding protein 2-like [Zingiber officinale]XP_042426712.1 telomere repeat-binding protein 2-like [Zingiber officinale]
MNLWDMVSQKRLDNGFGGYRLPPIPHFPKSAKRKRSARKRRDDEQLCAFDLLVEVAGKLSSESENSTLPPFCIIGRSKEVAKQDLLGNKEELKTEIPDLLSNTVLAPEIVVKKQVAYASNKLPQASKPEHSEPLCLRLKSKIYDTAAGGSVVSNSGIGIGCSASTDICRSGSIRKSSENRLELEAMDIYSLEDPMDLDVKPPAPASSDSSAEVPVSRDNPCSSSMPKHESGIEHIVHRDDDDNSSGCTHPNTITNKASRPTNCIGDHGERNFSASKYWKAAINLSKYGQISHHDIQRKPFLHDKKTCYTRQRTQRSYFKRRKLFERCPVSASNRGFFRMKVSNTFKKDSNKLEAHDPRGTAIRANGVTSPKAEQSSYKSVKFSIKSFKIPELYIEIPETATVGSLKRAVMEAVTAILQGGLHVGVILQGKKVRDDNKTLCQFGISNGDALDSLGFTLEPTTTQMAQQLTSSDNSRFLCLDDAVQPLARIPPISLPIDRDPSDASPQPALTSCPKSDHDSVHSPTNTLSLDKTTENKLALVALPAMDVEALAVVPLRNPKRLEHAQRRIRRPFSVTEVEALVEAVEKLGTGRWRDVKLRAFDTAKHRTYVDLKDKWKTLVHTANISPQQRRGEPVPQELLDRVLSAQAYWSQQQAKLRIKEEPPLPLPPVLCSSDPNQQFSSSSSSSLLEPVGT